MWHLLQSVIATRIHGAKQSNKYYPCNRRHGLHRFPCRPQLVVAGAKVVVLDSLCNGEREVINRIETIMGHHPNLVLSEFRDRDAFRVVFAARSIGASIWRIATCYANQSLAEEVLGWEAEYNIDRMCLDALR